MLSNFAFLTSFPDVISRVKDDKYSPCDKYFPSKCDKYSPCDTKKGNFSPFSGTLQSLSKVYRAQQILLRRNIKHFHSLDKNILFKNISNCFCLNLHFYLFSITFTAVFMNR